MSDLLTTSADQSAEDNINFDSTFSDAPEASASPDQEETPFEEPEEPEVTPEITPEPTQALTPSESVPSSNFDEDTSSEDRVNIITPPDTSTTDSGSDTDAPGDSSTTHTLDDLYTLLEAWQKEQQENREADQEALEEYKTKFTEYKEELDTYKAEVTEYRTYMKDQSRNIFSADVLIFLSLAFVSGILLARVVWRKL